MTIIKDIYVGDKNYDINFTIQDANKNPIDLTDATLAFVVQVIGDTKIKFTGDMDIVSEKDGTCKYTVADKDFDAAGEYYAEIQVTYSITGELITFGDILIKVKSKLPR